MTQPESVRVDLDIVLGASQSFSYVLESSSDGGETFAPISLVDCVITADVRRSAEEDDDVDPAFSFTVNITDEAAGEFELTLAAEDTVDLDISSSGEFVYDVRFEWVAGTVMFYQFGLIHCERTCTRE